MLALHENPILNDIHLPTFDADDVLPSYLLLSYEQIKVMLLPTSVEELSKIWATINKPYRLSVAYEVSLVELVPDREVPEPALVDRTVVSVVTIGAPHLSTLSPTTGALARLVGGAVTANRVNMLGSGLGRPGRVANVEVGGRPAPLTAPPVAPFTSLTADLPDDLDAGPEAVVRVDVAGQASEPLLFTVVPWLAAIRPVRTALDSTVSGDTIVLLSGQGIDTPFTVRFVGPGGALTATGAVTADGARTADLPTGLTNGAYEVRAVLDDGRLSNPRTVQVLPRLAASPTVSLAGAGHKLDLTGARLAGDEVDVVVDGEAYQVATNASPSSLSITFKRLLAPGPHEVYVQIDGHRSRAVAFTVPE
jgi:hypothetical protein